MFILLYMSIILGVITYFEYQNYKISQKLYKNMGDAINRLYFIYDVNREILTNLYSLFESYDVSNFEEENINEKK